MKFTKFGKALLMGALSAGVILCVTSCVRSYSVGYLYVTGTVTSESTGNGIISGYSIDHNTGFLTPIHGLPVASGGANPGRAVMMSASRFLYVLNRGVNSSGGATCTTADPCQNSNITEFVVGGNGILTSQQTFYTQGVNPFRIVADSSGGYIFVLDHDAPDNSTCKLALGSSATTCGVTVFKVDESTGRLSLVVNAQITQSGGTPLTYFPVPANPIDFVLSSGNILTLSGTATAGDTVFPYLYSSSTGQLTLQQSSAQTLGIKHATAIVVASGVTYVLDNESVTISSSSTFAAGTYPGQLIPYTVSSGGALQAQTGGVIPIDSSQANPIYVMVESKGKYLYALNQGNNVQGNNANSGITGYNIYSSPSYQLTFLAEDAFGIGSGPQCMVEDPSSQFIYTANFVDSTITGRALNPVDGILRSLNVASSYTLQGPASWCLVSGRTN
jgi:6-phosphogluconolactonase (cycloisomerase 2 family)